MAGSGAYGTWRSAVTSREVARAVGLRTVALGAGGCTWWEEIRPEEDGRSVLLRAAADGEAGEVLASELEALGGHHGLRSWLPVDERTAVVAHEDALNLVRAGCPPRTLTAGAPGAYRDLVLGPDGWSVWCVRERSEQAIVSVPLDGSHGVQTLLSTRGSVGTPRPSPGGKLLAWIAWEQPDMPWDGCQLWVGQVTAEGVAHVRAVLGGSGESVFQPEWTAPDALSVVSDRSRWWNPYEVGVDGSMRPLACWPEEFGWPQWEDGLATYGPLAGGRLAVLHGTGDWRLDVLNPATGTLAPLDLPYTAWQPRLRTSGNTIAGIGGSPTRPAAVVAVNAATGAHRVLRWSMAVPARGYVSAAEWTTFAGRNGHEVHAVIRPPQNPDYRPSERERIPYVLLLRDCPADRAMRMLDPVTMFFTSRGVGVADIVCRGASGFGRGYREQIYGQWGIADVEDCVVVGRGLIQHHGADPARLVVRGVGVGGATALGVLARTNLCAGGVIYAGVCDLRLLAEQGNHRLADHLRALAADSTLQREQSWLEGIRRPVLVFHGGRDEIVAPSQSRLLNETLGRIGVPHACLLFSHEGHDFRRADAISRTLDAEMGFYGQILGFIPADGSPLALRST